MSITRSLSSIGTSWSALCGQPFKVPIQPRLLIFAMYEDWWRPKKFCVSKELALPPPVGWTQRDGSEEMPESLDGPG